MKIEEMNAKGFVTNFIVSDLRIILDEKKAARLKSRLQEAGLFARHSANVTPNEAALFVIMAAILPTFEKGFDMRKGAEGWIALYYERLTRTTANSGIVGHDPRPVKTSLAELAEIIADAEKIRHIAKVQIDCSDGAMLVTYSNRAELEFVGVNDETNYYSAARREITLTRAALHHLASWTKE